MADNIILIGPMGAGKTTIGRKLARLLKRDFVDIDNELVTRLGVSIQTIFDTEGELGFRKRELTMLTTVLAENNHAVVATGGGCVLTEDCRKLMMLQRLVIHLDVGIKQQYERLKKDKSRPILQGGHLTKKLKQLRTERHEIYQSIADLYWPTDRKGFQQLAKIIKQHITS